MGRLYVIGAVAALCVACGGGSSINTREVRPCPPGHQITGRNLRDALRRQGFSAVCVNSSGTQVANETPTGQGDQADREGGVLCTVLKYMPPRMARRPHHVFEYGSLVTHSQPGREFYVANIGCSLYLDPKTRSDAPMRLGRVFHRLAKTPY